MHLSHQFPQSVLKREPECLKIRGKQIAVWHRLIDWGNMRGCARFFGGRCLFFLKCVLCWNKKVWNHPCHNRKNKTTTFIPYQHPTVPGHGSSTRKATGFGSLDTNATTQEGPINNLSSLNRQTRLDLQRKQKSGVKNLLCLQEYQTSGTRHCLTLPHRSVMLRKYFNVPCNALKNKKSPHRIAVKPRDCWK